MTTVARNAIHSFRVIARINMRQARTAKRNGFTRLAAHHVAVAMESREDANSLLRTAI